MHYPLLPEGGIVKNRVTKNGSIFWAKYFFSWPSNF